MPPAAEMKQVDDDSVRAGGSVDVASHHPGLPPSLSEIEIQTTSPAVSPSPSSVDLRMRKGAAAGSQSPVPGGLSKHHRQMTLKDVAGEYSALTHLPKARSQHQNSSPIPILRWGKLYFWLTSQTLSSWYYRVNTSVIGKEKLDELTDIHGILGGVIGFVVAFRVNMAYQSYMKGRRLVGSLMNGLREVVLECYSLLPQADTAAGSAATNDALLGAAREVRRLCNILFAFVRQDVRESINGFLPGSDLERVPFDPTKNYYMDPCRPRPWDLLSDSDMTHYAKIPSRMRPCAVLSDILRQVSVIEQHCGKAGSPRLAVSGALKGILVVHESMVRLNTCPVPYPLICMLHISVFLFVYSTPFWYLAHTTLMGTLSCIFFLVLGYYGLLAIADSLERPFAYTHGSFNIELESFGLKFHDDMLQVARLFSDDNESFLPQYLSSADSAKRAEGKEAGKETKA